MIVVDTSGYTLLALLCVLIHECGHLFMLSRFKVSIEKISLRIFGISIKTGSTVGLNSKREIAVALSGCGANLITVIICETLRFFSIFPGKCAVMSAFSIVIGGMNLLPIGSLDGSRVLEIILLNKLTPDKVDLILNITSAVFLIPLASLCILLFLKGTYNISLIAVAAYLTAFLFIKNDKKTMLKVPKHLRD